MLQIAMFTFSPIQENTYLLYNQAGEVAIIDPGCYYQSEREELASFIKGHGLRVTHLLQTHCHLDHVFGLQWATETFGLQPYMHPLEKAVLQWGPTSAAMYNLPFECYSGHSYPLAAGDEILLGTDVLKVLFAPGHSPGHVCFYNAAQGFVIGGDVLFEQSIGRTDLPGGDQALLLQSIRQQLFTLPGSTVVYPGHGPATTIEQEKKTNPFLQ